MSLIHDALKSMEAPQESKPVGARAPAVMARHRPAWLDAVLAFVVVLGAGVLGWFIWQSQMKPKTDLPPSSAVSVTSPASVPQQLVAASPPPTAEMAQSPQQPAAPQGNLAVPADVAILLPNPMAQPSPVPQQQMPSPSALDTAVPKALASVSLSDVRSAPAQTAARQSSSRQVQTSKPGGLSVAAPAVAPVVDDTPVELRFARFVSAMKEGRTVDAENELTALKERLPLGSLGLLRAQAWFDLRAGRDAAATEGYRAILERMPGDEEAAINLASIQSRQHKSEEARATLDAAARLQPDSAALRAALAQFTPAARQ